MTDEEKELCIKVGLNYQRQSMIRHNKQLKDLSTKCWLQQEALQALPATLRATAEIPDDSYLPSDRPFPFYDTPPIKGFNINDYISSIASDDDANFS